VAETDVKCVELKSDRQSIYRMNEFYGIHCHQRQTCHGEKESQTYCVLSQGCHGLVAYVTGKSA